MARKPRDVIPRVQAQRSHHEFLDVVNPETAMLNLIEARKLAKRGETAATYFGEETDVIVTSTVRDRDLDLLSWEREFEIVCEVVPDYHIPTDYPTYGNMAAEQRHENVRRCMTGTLWMAEQIDKRGLQTQVIPLIKGITPHEREICYRAIDSDTTDAKTTVTADYRAYYVTQYFSAGQGNNIGKLVEDVGAIAEEWDGDLLVIGLLSANYLAKLPESVVAAAGMNAWRTDVAPRKQTPAEMRKEFATLVEDVSDAIGTKHPPTARSATSER